MYIYYCALHTGSVQYLYVLECITQNLCAVRIPCLRQCSGALYGHCIGTEICSVYVEECALFGCNHLQCIGCILQYNNIHAVCSTVLYYSMLTYMQCLVQMSHKVKFV